MLGPFLVPAFFLAAWITMIFWGIIAPQIDLPTIGYARAMLVTLALWLVVFPVAMAVRGPGFAAGRKFRAGRGAMAAESGDAVKATAVFSGTSRRISSQHFKGGDATAVFGGVELDLRNAVIESKPAVLNVTADERKDGHPAPDGPQPDLLITGTAVFGGVAVKA
ncbi:MAG: hypothetical protein FJ320_10860 [SAR202 cluster bacterium]|nr:hypothetical protein [SAR202 cluster bacterium]